MAVTYDEDVIVTFAERLYRRAATVVLMYGLFGGGVGALMVEGVAIVNRLHATSTNSVAVLAGLIGALLGVIAGNGRAFALRLLAQQALCQVQIERNTRMAAAVIRTPMVSRPAPPPPPSPMPRGAW